LKTEVRIIFDIEKDYKTIREGAELIQKGELVAFPTETVYGLGANALDAEAVAKIYEAKGRPGDNPLIVHVAHFEDVKPLVLEIPEKAKRLMEAFWPGPLTLILKKSTIVPYRTTGGLDTVAVRMPKHPVALALIHESGVPIAAPSANRSGRPSPTNARHVMNDMIGRIPMILDGGACNVGVESTVLDVTGDIPNILRPGGITPKMLESVIGQIKVDDGVLHPLNKGTKVLSPGMKYTHYAPQAQVIIVKGKVDKMIMKIREMAADEARKGNRVGILATEETFYSYPDGEVLCLGSRKNPQDLAANLFASLRKFDDLKVDIILAEWIEEKDEGLAVMNRMLRAAGFHIVEA